MARTPLMQLLHCAARQSVEATAIRTPLVSRRAILQAGAGLALNAALPATGLAATAKIAIVGAGLAGLTAGYRLQKAGYSPDIYEASTRLGGRCYTARGVFADGQIAEHGGEFIDTGHKEIRALAAELGLTLDDALAATPARTEPRYLIGGRPYSLADATRDFRPFHPALQAQRRSLGRYSYLAAGKAARRFDEMTMSAWVAAYVPGGREGQLGQLIETAFAEENAADAERQSALNAIAVLANDPPDRFNLYYTDSDQRFHVRGGNDQIPSLLGERLGARIRTAMPLAAIVRLPSGQIRLSLKNGSAMQEAVYDRVILALPFSVLHAAVDCTKAGFRPLKQKAIATLPMGASVKFQMQFSRRAWTEAGCNGEIRVPTRFFQTSWEVSRAQQGEAGILNFFSGGTRALNAGGQSADALGKEVLRDAEQALPGIGALWNGRLMKDAWKENPWSLGSYSYYPPGYQTSIAGIEAEREGNCFFAGEHTSDQPGYLNSGVETGMRAAREVIASLRRGPPGN